MNIKIKTSIIILITLVIGILIGTLTNWLYYQNRIRKFITMRTPNYFMVQLENYLNPSQEQSKKIRPILQKHSEEMRNIRDDFQKRMETAFESFRKEIEPLLTPEQLERIKRPPKEMRVPGMFPQQRRRPFLKHQQDKPF